MQIKCSICGNIEDFSNNIGFRDECSKCKSSLHICKNCAFYSETSYNECKEPQADRVLDKEKANYCDYFKANENLSNLSKTQSKEDVYNKLNSLFSK